MLSLIALTAVLLQDPPAPPPSPEVRSRVVFLGGSAEGPGGLDANDDGEVTREEFAAPLNDAFARLDKNGDGRLSRDELAQGASPGDVAVRVGRPGGSGVERLEIRRDAAGEGRARFERDGDRTVVFVSPDRAGAGEPVVIHSRRSGPHRIELEGGAGVPRDARVELRTVGGPHGAELDKDGDGRISEAEFTAPLREAFARMDADGSGFIEEGERGGDTDVRIFTRRLETRDEE